MNNLTNLFLFLVLSLSCSIATPKKNFTVIITVDSSLCTPQQYLYLYYFRHNECNIEDSALVSVNHRTVHLKGYIPEQEKVSLLFEKQGPGRVDIIATPNDTISISIGKEDMQNTVCKSVIGSPATNEEAIYFDRLSTLIKKRLSLLEKMQIYQSDSIQSEIKEEYEEIETELRRNEILSLKTTQHPYIAWVRSITLSTNDYGTDSVRRLKDEVLSRFPNYEKMERLKPDRKKQPSSSEKSLNNQHRIQQIIEKKRELNNQKKNVEFKSKDIAKEKLQIQGRYALWNIKANNINDTPTTLPLSTGKYTFINFWASWCMPCMHELLFLNQLHDKYGNQLVIYNISLDKDKKKWKNTLQTLNLNNLYNFSAIDNAGNLHKNIERLNIETIPANYLLSPEGEILSIDITKKQLVHTLDSIFEIQ